MTSIANILYQREVYGHQSWNNIYPPYWGRQTNFISSAEYFVKRLQLNQTLECHSGCVNTVRWNNKGTMIVSGSDDLYLGVWRIHFQKDIKSHLISKFKTKHTQNIFHALFVPYTDDDEIISCALDCDVRYNRISRNTSERIGTHRSSCHKVDMIDHYTFLSCSEDGTIKLMDMRDSKTLNRTTEPFDDNTLINLTKISLENDTNTNNKKSKSNSCEQVALYTAHLTKSKVTCYTLTLNPINNNILAVGCGDKWVRLYDRRSLSLGQNESSKPFTLLTQHKLLHKTTEDYYHDDGVTGLAWSYDGREIVATYSQSNIALFDLYTPLTCEDFQDCETMKKNNTQFLTENENIAKNENINDNTTNNNDTNNNDTENHLFDTNENKEIDNKTIDNGKNNMDINMNNSHVNRNKSQVQTGLLHLIIDDTDEDNEQSNEENDEETKEEIGRLLHSTDDVTNGNNASDEKDEKDEKMKNNDVSNNNNNDDKRNNNNNKNDNNNKDVNESNNIKLNDDNDDDDDIDIEDIETNENEDFCDEDDENINNEKNIHYTTRVHQTMNKDKGVFESFDQKNKKHKMKNNSIKKECYIPYSCENQQYSGHATIETVKECNFFGSRSEYIISGSDCGHVFIWRKKDGEIVNMLQGDGRITNVVQGNPTNCSLVTSGLDETVKLFLPTAENANEMKEKESIIESNRQPVRRGIGRIPISLLIQLLRDGIIGYDTSDDEQQNENNDNDNNDNDHNDNHNDNDDHDDNDDDVNIENDSH